jgi:hypothetical protein
MDNPEKKIITCPDCGEKVEQEGYCNNCELRHQLVFGDR